MNDIDKLREEIIAFIQEAFAGVRREDGITMREADEIDGYSSKWRQLRARRKDTDKHWHEISPDLIEQYYVIFCYLDEKGFRYYIPAYMIWALNNLNSNSMSLDSTIYACRPAYRNFESFLSPEQCKAICRFLRFMAEHSDGMADDVVAQEYLDDFWGKFCTHS